MTPEERIAKTIRDDWTGCGQDWSPANGVDYATHVAAVVVEELYDHGPPRCIRAGSASVPRLSGGGDVSGLVGLWVTGQQEEQ